MAEAGEPAALPNAPGPLWRLAGGAAGVLRVELLFCEENPLLYDDDVPECEDVRASATTLVPSARHNVSNSADWKDFMMSFRKEVE
ncbi:hypothetical protein [Duganella sp. BJB1802]|uniref:hypothetical protein n=1 Tax=Duganella sp. BJB1802 TaxID=2744575 RepID=UPI001E3129E7|nr:hypothetical protein [Duganella sp. BJB1802]